MGIDEFLSGQSASGWSGSNKFICPTCVGDGFLASVVSDAVSEGKKCSFCGDVPAASFDVLMDAFMVGVRNRFEQADNAGMPWEGGYVFSTRESSELPEEFDWVAAGPDDSAVIDEIRSCLEPKTYASRWWLELEPHQAYSSAWREFCNQIMYRTRFVFWVGKDDAAEYEGAGQVSVAKVLGAIGHLLKHFGLVITLPPGTVAWRARGHGDPTASGDWGAADLGTNTPERSTTSTRMSPAGIPLFYGADTLDTALAEVSHAGDGSESYTVAQFTTTAPMKVIDLTDLPPIPSIFDPGMGRWCGELEFLHELVDDLRKPVHESRSNLDYVPTQVFTEYFLRVFEGGGLRGLRWISSVADGRCVALNVPQSDCLNEVEAVTPGRPQLRLLAKTKEVYSHGPQGLARP